MERINQIKRRCALRMGEVNSKLFGKRAFLLAAACASVATAANTTYVIPDASTGNFSSLGFTPTAGDILSDPSTDAPNPFTLTLDQNVTVGAILLNAGSSHSGTFVTDGSHVFTLDDTGGTTLNAFGTLNSAIAQTAGSGSLVEGADVVIANTDLGIGSTGAGAVLVSGNITASTAQNLFLRSNSTGSNAISGNIGASGSAITINNVGSGAGSFTLSGVLGTNVSSVTQNGASTLVLSNANTYTGGTTIRSGRVYINNVSGAGTGSITLAGGQLQLNLTTTIANTVNVVATSSYFPNADLGIPLLTSPGASISGVGAPVLNATLTDSTGKYNSSGSSLTSFFGTLELGTSTGSLRFTGSASGAQYANIDLGTSTAFLSNAESNTSTLTYGALSGGASTTLTGNVASARGTTYVVGGINLNTEFDGLISDGLSPVIFTKTGAGVLTLTHAETYTGATSVLNGGTLQMNFPAATTSNPLPNSALTLGGALSMTGSAGATDAQAFTALTVTSGPAKLITTNGTGGSTTITIAGTPVRTTAANTAAVGGALQIGLNSNVVFPAYVSKFLIQDTQSNAYAIYGTDDWAATDANGRVIAATYTPYTAGSTVVSNGAAIDDIQGSATGAAISAAALRFSNTPTTGAVTLALSGTNTVGGVLMTSGSAGATLSGAFLRPNRSSVAGASLNVFQDSTAGDLNISIPITTASSSTPVALVKAGPGRVILSGANSYNGQTFINEGVISIPANVGLGVESTGAAVNLFNGALEATSSFALENSAAAGTNIRAIALNGNGGLYAATGQTLTVNGVISGTGILNVNPAGGSYVVGSTTVSDAGTIALSAGNAFSGGVVLNAGTLQINGEFAIGGAVNRGVTFNGGALRYTAGITGTNGTTDISQTSAGFAQPVSILAGGASIDTNGNDVRYANGIGNGGSGSLTKLGTGSLTLTGQNVYSGATNVSAGTLSVDGSAVGSTSSLVSTSSVAVASGGIFRLIGRAATTPSLMNSGATVTVASGGLADLILVNQTQAIAGLTLGSTVESPGVYGSAAYFSNLGLTGTLTPAQVDGENYFASADSGAFLVGSTPAPEPASIAGLAILSAGLLGRRRRS